MILVFHSINASVVYQNVLIEIISSNAIPKTVIRMPRTIAEKYHIKIWISALGLF